MTANPYQTYARTGRYPRGNSSQREMISSDVYQQLREREEANRARYKELGREIVERIGVETYYLWVDTLPEACDTSAAEMVKAHERYLAELEAEAEEAISEGCPTAHAHAEIVETGSFGDEPAGEALECPDCGERFGA